MAIKQTVAFQKVEMKENWFNHLQDQIDELKLNLVTASNELNVLR
jgi:hypothetical protein